MTGTRKLWTGCVLALASVVGCPASGAVVNVETVSPGATSRIVRIDASCPSFSWGAVADADIWELVVYELAGMSGGGRVVLAVRVPGSALSWTPSLEECFEPGGRYAWIVRPLDEQGAGPWSDPRLFEVAAAPTIAEVERAMKVLERFIGARTGAESVLDGAAPEGTPSDGDHAVNPTAAPGSLVPLVSGVEIGESSITIGDQAVVTTATDQDTLGGMSCADGELPRWHAGSGSWVCGEYAAGDHLFLDIDTFHVEDGAGSDLDADLLDGFDSADFAQLALASAFTATPVSSGVGGGSLYINPATGVKEDNTLLGAAVAGAQKFRVDIEGDVELTGSINKGLTVMPEITSGLGFASPDVIAGHSSNQVTAGVAGAGIGGGGARRVSDGALFGNIVTDDFGSIGGGLANRAGDGAGTTSDKRHATVGGGNTNVAAGLGSVVGGGVGNEAAADFSTVGGGSDNETTGEYAAVSGGLSNQVSANGGSVGGGESNSVTDRWAAVAGGAYNVAGDGAGTSSDEEFAAVGGGYGNEARAGHATIGGGSDNLVTDRLGTVGGGSENQAGDNLGTTADRIGATVAGGTQNVASGQGSVVGGGGGNTAGGLLSTISGGGTNSAEDLAATVAGGQFNRAAGESAVVGGGDSNEVLGDFGTVAGGYLNRTGSLGGGEAYATVAGGAGNTAAGDYAAVGGGSDNAVTDEYGAVGGGKDNQAGNAAGTASDARIATVAGGEANVAGASGSTVGGGSGNQAVGVVSVVAGGQANAALAADAAIGGGDHNTVQDAWGSIGGGSYNYAGNAAGGVIDDDPYATVAGGTANHAGASKAAIGGGADNTAVGVAAAIAGGENNSVLAKGGFVGGGSSNEVNDEYATVAGGVWNEAGDDDGLAFNQRGATVSGGELNVAHGAYSAIAGGYNNTTTGSKSFVAGGMNNTAIGEASFVGGSFARAQHDGSFVWNASSWPTVTTSEAENQIFLRASGGLHFEDPAGIEAAVSVVKGSASVGTGAAMEAVNRTDYGEVGWFGQIDVNNLQPVVKLVLPSGIPTNQLRNFLECDIQGAPATRKCHIDKDGTFHAGSDFAEALPALGDRRGYEPGDVLLMDEEGAGVEKGSEPYSPRVAGVYSTRPGLLGADKDGETRVDEQDVPVAIVGIVPTKVSGENGPIAVGDLLVNSKTSGHAMKGTDASRMQGAIVGKALEPFNGERGVIRVLVSLL